MSESSYRVETARKSCSAGIAATEIEINDLRDLERQFVAMGTGWSCQ